MRCPFPELPSHYFLAWSIALSLKYNQENASVTKTCILLFLALRCLPIHAIKVVNLTVQDREKWKHESGYHHSLPSKLTLLQYFAKVLVMAGAVPPAVPELILALPDAQPGSFGNLTDDLWLSLAQLSLLPCQTLCLSANTVGVHHQRTAHCPRKYEHC